MLRAAGVGVGDEVIDVAFGNVEIAGAVTLAGALPVFADVDPVTYCLESAAVEAVVTSRTAAVVVVHRFGRLLLMSGGCMLWGSGMGCWCWRRGVRDAVRRDRAASGAGRLSGRAVAGVRMPDGGDGHTYQQYVVRVPGNGRPDRDAFARALRGGELGAGCR